MLGIEEFDGLEDGTTKAAGSEVISPPILLNYESYHLYFCIQSNNRYATVPRCSVLRVLSTGLRQILQQWRCLP